MKDLGFIKEEKNVTASGNYIFCSKNIETTTKDKTYLTFHKPILYAL